MTTVLIVIHLMVVLALIGLVLLQRSEGGALGIGGGGAFLSGRGAGNVLTRSTGILAAVFFATSIGLALLSRLETRPSDIFDQLPGQAETTEPRAPAAPLPTGAPQSAEDVLRGLGGSAPGPQTPPAAGGAAAPEGSAPQAPAAPAPITETAPEGSVQSPSPANGAAGSSPGAAESAAPARTPAPAGTP